MLLVVYPSACVSALSTVNPTSSFKLTIAYDVSNCQPIDSTEVYDTSSCALCQTPRMPVVALYGIEWC